MFSQREPSGFFSRCGVSVWVVFLKHTFGLCIVCATLAPHSPRISSIHSILPGKLFASALDALSTMLAPEHHCVRTNTADIASPRNHYIDSVPRLCSSWARFRLTCTAVDCVPGPLDGDSVLSSSCLDMQLIASHGMYNLPGPNPTCKRRACVQPLPNGLSHILEYACATVVGFCHLLQCQVRVRAPNADVASVQSIYGCSVGNADKTHRHVKCRSYTVPLRLLLGRDPSRWL